jgi:hypothetical protein
MNGVPRIVMSTTAAALAMASVSAIPAEAARRLA